MRIIVLILAFAGPLIARAENDSFGSRIQRADIVEASQEGAEYQKSLWSKIGNNAASAMQNCFPKSKKTDATSFVLVGDVTKICHLENIEVRPNTPMTRCFAAKLSNNQFPEPPEAFIENGMPLVIKVRVTN